LKPGVWMTGVMGKTEWTGPSPGSRMLCRDGKNQRLVGSSLVF